MEGPGAREDSRGTVSSGHSRTTALWTLYCGYLHKIKPVNVLAQRMREGSWAPTSNWEAINSWWLLGWGELVFFFLFSYCIVLHWIHCIVLQCMCMAVLPACIPCVCSVFLLYVKVREGIRSALAGAIGSWELPHECWELDLNPVQEQPLFLITEPSLYPWVSFL